MLSDPLVNSDLDPKFWSKTNTCITPIHVYLEYPRLSVLIRFELTQKRLLKIKTAIHENMDGSFNFILDNAIILNTPNIIFPQAQC
jgi:hypothetical protein